jgi:hypothetical protein
VELPLKAVLRSGWDGEADGLHRALPEIGNDPLCTSVEQAEYLLHDRIDYIRSGTYLAPDFANRMLRDFDRFLRFRWSWDYEAWAVDRFDNMNAIWNRITIYDEILTVDKVHRILDDLRERDMWRYSSPAEYLRVQREKAEKVRQNNAKAADDNLMAAVDSLSSSRLNNFIEVEQAIARGERIVAHGPDLRTLERILKSQQDTLARGEGMSAHYDHVAAINPGMNPKFYGRVASKHRAARKQQPPASESVS